MSNFDDSFESLLQRTIENDAAAPAFMGEPLGHDEQFQLIGSDKVRNFIQAFNRMTLAFLLELSGIDILITDLRSVPREASLSEKLKEPFRSTRSKPLKRWPRILFAIWLCAFALVVTGVYYQYIYDANSFKLHKLDEHVRGANGSREHLDGKIIQLRDKFKSRARQAREMLDALGVAHVEWSFALESIVITFSLFPMVVNRLIVSPMVWLKRPWLALSPRALLDRRNESQTRTKLTLMELNKFSQDSLSFAITKLEQLSKDLTRTIADSNMNQREQLERLRHEVLTKFALRLRDRHQTTIRQLKQIALAGGLNPLNRTTACRDRLALWYFVGCVGTFLYMNVLLVIGYLFSRRFHAARGALVEHNSLRKLFNSFNWFMITEFGALVALLHLVLVVIIVQDHMVFVARLRTIVLHTIKSNESNFRCLTRIHHQDITRARLRQTILEQIELNLLTLIMQNRLFVKSYALALTPLNMILHVLLPFSILAQVVFKVHSAYFDPDLASASTLLGLAIALASLMFLFPLGRLHQSCIKTLHCYWTLVAQMSHYEQYDNISRTSIMQLSVAIFRLRREMADSRQTTDSFACQVLSVRITNSNTIRIAFWMMLLIVSLSGSVNLFGESLTKFMRDPFGLLVFVHEISSS